jgi:capsular exopolysaccharide synthesis family protein
MQTELTHESSRYPSVDARTYLLLIWSHLWLLILAAILAGALAFGASHFIAPTYAASTTLLIDEAPYTGTDDYNSLLASERRARTYAQLLTEQPVLEATIERLELGYDIDALKEMVSARRVPDTQLIEIQVEGRDPEEVAAIANTLVEVFIEQTETIQSSRYAASKASLAQQLQDMEEQIRQTAEQIDALGNSPEDRAERDRLETLLAQYRQTHASLLESYEQIRIAEAQAASNVIQVKEATPPSEPISPNLILNTVLGGLLGLMLGTSAVFAKEMLDDTVKSPDQVAQLLGLPTLGMIAEIDPKDGMLITVTKPRSVTAEAFRALRTNIQYAGVDRRIQLLLVTSPSPQDGKTTVAANLGAVLALNGRETIVVEADLHHPTLHSLFGIETGSGLSDLFVKPLNYMDRVLKASGVPNLSILASGPLPPNPTELLDSDRARRILDQLTKQAEIVVIDSPPVLAVADASVLGPHVDGILLVLRVGKTKLRLVQQAVKQLEQVNARVVGVVLTGIKTRSAHYSSYYYYGYGYGYYHSHKEEASAGERAGNSEPLLPLLRRSAVSSQPPQTPTGSGNGSHPQPVLQSATGVAVAEAPEHLPLTYPASLEETQPRLTPIATEEAYLPQAQPSRRSKRHRRSPRWLHTLLRAGVILAGALTILCSPIVMLTGSASPQANLLGGACMIIVGGGLIFMGIGGLVRSSRVAYLGMSTMGIGVSGIGLILLVQGISHISSAIGGGAAFARAIAGLTLTTAGLLPTVTSLRNIIRARR